MVNSMGVMGIVELMMLPGRGIKADLDSLLKNRLKSQLS